MKYSFLALGLLLVAINSIAQTNTFPATGNTGLGTSTPSQKLTVAGNINILASTAGHYFAFGVPSYDEYNTIGSLYSSAALTICHGLKPHPSLPTLVYSHPGMSRNAIMVGGFSENGIKFYTKEVSEEIVGETFNDSPRMVIKNDGNVGIGTIYPNEKLAVNGKIRAKEIKVEVANWPDYVFTRAYQLSTLKETEKHIKEKGHLPGIPSAEEVKTNGVDLGEMNVKLLQKIEELTLHLIEKDKQLLEQKLINTNQEDRLRKLEITVNKK